MFVLELVLVSCCEETENEKMIFINIKCFFFFFQFVRKQFIDIFWRTLTD